MYKIRFSLFLLTLQDDISEALHSYSTSLPPRQTAQITFAFCALLKKKKKKTAAFTSFYCTCIHHQILVCNCVQLPFCCLQYANAPRCSFNSAMHLYKLQMCTNRDSHLPTTEVKTATLKKIAFLQSHEYLQHLCSAVPVRDCNSSILNGD